MERFLVFGVTVRPALAQFVSGGTRPAPMAGVAVAGSDCLRGHLLFSAGDVADDLRPEAALGAPSYGDEAVDRGPVGIEQFEDLADTEGDALVDGSEEMAAGVANSKAGYDAAGA